MQAIKKTFKLLLALIGTILVFVTGFLFFDNTVGTYALITGLLILLGFVILSGVGLLKGSIEFLKMDNRTSIFLFLLYSVISTVLLTLIWGFNYALQNENGHMSVIEKVSVIQGNAAINEKEIQTFIEEYPVVEHEHITFKYHPDTEEHLENLIHSIKDIEQLEKEIYGSEIRKTNNLEVLVLKNHEDYLQLTPYYRENEAGSYHPHLKRTIIFSNSSIPDADETFLVRTFVHEYSHYLFDMYTAAEGLTLDEVPAWYNEGISEWIEKQVVWTDLLIDEGEIEDIHLTELFTNESWRNVSQDKNVYHLALRGVEYIVAQHGDVRVLSDILVQQKQTDSFEEAYTQVMGSELDDLDANVFPDNEAILNALNTWDKEGKFEEASRLYKDLTEKHPHDSLIWHQYAMMLEEQKNWDEAVYARRNVIDINIYEAPSYLYLSYLLTVSDPEEAVEIAEKALQLTKDGPYGNIGFYEQWVEEITRFQRLMAEERYSEAYENILKSEQLSYNESIYEEVKQQASDYSR